MGANPRYPKIPLLRANTSMIYPLGLCSKWVHLSAFFSRLPKPEEMSNRSRKAWNKSWKSGFASKAAPRPSKLEGESASSPDRTADCLSECLDAFKNSIFPWDEAFDKIYAAISSESFVLLYCCDSKCAVQGLLQKGQDRELNRSRYLDFADCVANVNEAIRICKR